MSTYIAGKKVGSVFIGGKRVSSMYKGGKCIYRADGGEVPIECGLVFTGTQRINTGIQGSSNLRVMVDVIQNTVSADTPLFGSRVGMTDRTWCYWQQVNADVRTDYNVTGYAVARSNAPFNQRLIIDKNKNITKVNGTTIHTAPAASFTNTIDLYLGNVGTAQQHANNFNGTMYSCQIYDNDVLVRDLVPVPQGSTKYSSSPAPSNCMWDKVRQQYFENAGTGNFRIIET
jgi:hypothetical protein